MKMKTINKKIILCGLLLMITGFILLIICKHRLLNFSQLGPRILITCSEETNQLTPEDLDLLYQIGIQTTDQEIISKRQTLLEKAKQLFNIRTVMENVVNRYKYSPTNIIVWLTDHKGDVSDKALEWYIENIFGKITPEMLVCGTNLEAWYVLANKAAGLGDLRQRLDLISKGKAPNLNSKECPLFQSRSTTKIEDISKSRFRALQSINFFKWLQTFPKGITVKNLGSPNNKGLQNLLYRERPDSLSSDLTNNDARPGYSLRQLGFYSSFLDVERDNGKNILDCDVYTIFPLLEYLEVIFYIHYVIFSGGYSKHNYTQNIVFLLNIREIIYFVVPGEDHHLKTMRENIAEICKILNSEWTKKARITIDLQLFIYGDSLRGAPYIEPGAIYTSEEFTQKIKDCLVE